MGAENRHSQIISNIQIRMNYPAASRRGIKTISTVLYEWEYNS